MDVFAYRQAMQDALQEHLQIEFVPGQLEGPVEGRNLGSVYVRTVAEVGDRVNEQDVILVVRIFRAFEQIHEPQLPFDPAPLERLAVDLQHAVRAHQTGLGPWFQRLQSWEIDPELQGIEGIILAKAYNAGVIYDRVP